MFDFDLLLTAGPHDADAIQSFARKNGKSLMAVPVGLPFLDRLLDPSLSKDEYLRKLSLDPSRPTILFAPHWSRPDVLREQMDRCLAILQETGCNIVVKFHAALRHQSHSGEHSWWEKVQRTDRISVDEDINDVPALKHADILITDTSSRSYNFMLLDKPVILIWPVSYSHPADAERMRTMRSAALIADPLETLKAAIQDALRHPDRLRKERRQVASAYFANFGGSARTVAALIENHLAHSNSTTLDKISD
jgi:CDP-glycerol glycerophosphotransferase (TagB/SpsB family)